MNSFRRICSIVAVLIIGICTVSAFAETAAGDAEQGLNEIQPLLQITEVDGKEGMSLEEMTDAFAESAMNEYLDSATGFRMQYPSIFLFNEEMPGAPATTADGKATLAIDNMINQNGLDEETLISAIRLEAKDADIQKNEQNGCLRTDRVTDEGKNGRTDLYLLTKNSFHHIVICYPSDEQGTYFSYIEYMINTLETNETDLG